MTSFTGRPSTGKAKRFGKSLLDGLAYVGTALSDGPKYERIKEIDQLLIDLQQERDHLITELIEPGDLKVSDDYDPYWSKRTIVSSDGGRLTKCEGQSSAASDWHVHPGCPYKGERHNEHEFTLHD